MTTEGLTVGRRRALGAVAVVCLVLAAAAFIGAWRMRVLVENLNVSGEFPTQESYFEEINRLHILAYWLGELVEPLFLGGIAALTVLLVAHAWRTPRTPIAVDTVDAER
ncbi:hypothetical protein [uncultured Schumannella sp.]|uniref:hypothetical protein n=1 Tax=uncultured Schumannella sp. TaxID=1195956 RepID=UPI0025D67BB9|nr:hypothetical protein [uncultured Schumannella sp.]